MSGAPLALGAVAALMLGAQLRRRGHRNVSPLQARLLRVKNQYKDNPEIAVRAIGLVVSLLPGGTDAAAETKFSTAMLEDQIGMYFSNPRYQKPEHAAVVKRALAKGGRPSMVEYLDLLSSMVRTNTYYINGVNLTQDWMGTPYIPWVAREVARAKKAAKTEAAFITAMGKMRTQGQRILDWFSVASPDVSKLKWSLAKSRSDRWHRELEGTSTSRKRKNRSDTLPATVIYDWGDGWSAVELDQRPQFTEEGGLLHHCIGKVATYYDNTARGKTRTISLRKKGEPRLTVTISGADTTNPKVAYNHGMFDRAPGVPYHKKIEWFPDEVLYTECLKLRELFDKLDIHWTPEGACRKWLAGDPPWFTKNDSKLLEQLGVRQQGAVNRRRRR